jgi:hypothetical protein
LPKIWWFSIIDFSLSVAQTATHPPQKMQPADPDCADLAPSDQALTPYDEEPLVTYLCMLDANADGADWREVSRIVLHIDAEREPDRARRAFDSHLARARGMTLSGHKQLLRRDGGTAALMSRPDGQREGRSCATVDIMLQAPQP